MEDKPLGKVVHYFDKAMVAVVRLNSGGLKVGDSLKFAKDNREFYQSVESMQIDHKAVNAAKKGEEAAVKVSQPAKEGTLVYKI